MMHISAGKLKTFNYLLCAMSLKNNTAVAGVLHLQLNEHTCLPEKNSGKGE